MAFIIHIQPLSSPLLLRNPPNTFAFIPIPPMSLSSRNRSNSKAFRHILPCIAPVCEGMHYHKTGVPWQMNSTLIIFSYLHLSLVFFLKRLIFQGFPTFEFSFLFKVSSQIFSYFLMFFPAILVNPLVKQAPLPTGFFNYSLSDILLPLHHQNSHGCKCSRLH